MLKMNSGGIFNSSSATFIFMKYLMLAIFIEFELVGDMKIMSFLWSQMIAHKNNVLLSV